MQSQCCSRLLGFAAFQSFQVWQNCFLTCLAHSKRKAAQFQTLIAYSTSCFYFSYSSENWLFKLLNIFKRELWCLLCPVHYPVHRQYGGKQAELTIHLRENQSMTYLRSTGAPSYPPAWGNWKVLLCPCVLLNGCSPNLLSRLKHNLEHNKHSFQRKPECTRGRLHSKVLPDLKIRNKERLSFHLNSNFYFSDGLVKLKSCGTIQDVLSGVWGSCNLEDRYFYSLSSHRISKTCNTGQSLI